jgi:hypothetical protein
MKIEIMKERVRKELAKMGYSSEANSLIEKYFNQTNHITTARDKALYMIA